jgi:hypothetical protein
MSRNVVASSGYGQGRTAIREQHFSPAKLLNKLRREERELQSLWSSSKQDKKYTDRHSNILVKEQRRRQSSFLHSGTASCADHNSRSGLPNTNEAALNNTSSAAVHGESVEDGLRRIIIQQASRISHLELENAKLKGMLASNELVNGLSPNRSPNRLSFFSGETQQPLQSQSVMQAEPRLADQKTSWEI